MTQAELERIYEAMAKAIDAVGPDQSEVFLARLALALAEDLDQPERALEVIGESTAALTG
ncbi:hypothetical protein KZZ07_11690 [Mameliella sp. CS4]|uniref:hypothetical protein n=1 Tax=Mameliella sp. CS4 TaxID=2862329 RepID=UPI001C5EC09C|nr:hypothetical protein [Mameliella sp. CS4]MBW4983206.1 hypothetical protein [Mameliella sp. CS4]